MTAEAWAASVSAVCAVIALLGAGFAWWKANRSRAALREAESARDAAARTLAAVETQATAAQSSAESVEAIAKRLARPDIWLEWMDHDTLSLRTSLDSIIVTGIAAEADDEQFGGPDFKTLEDTPIAVTAHRPQILLYMTSFARAPQQSVRLQIEGRELPVEIPLPAGRPADPRRQSR